MAWVFDQAPNVAAISVRTVVGNADDNAPVLVVSHYSDDHSWAFLDGQAWTEDQAIVVSMKNILDAHPYLTEVADLPPGWRATRADVNSPWVREEDPDL